jgi:hypothetical protein
VGIKGGNMNGLIRSMVVVSGVLGYVYWKFGWVYGEVGKLIDVLNKVNGG